MKPLIFLVLIVPLSFSACTKNHINRETPECVNDRTRHLQNSTCNDGASIKEYKFQGNTVYEINFGCGIETTEVIDLDCNTLGTLGGFSGNDQINGELFSNATFVKTLWEK